MVTASATLILLLSTSNTRLAPRYTALTTISKTATHPKPFPSSTPTAMPEILTGEIREASSWGGRHFINGWHVSVEDGNLVVHAGEMRDPVRAYVHISKFTFYGKTTKPWDDIFVPEAVPPLKVIAGDGARSVDMEDAAGVRFHLDLETKDVMRVGQ